MDEDLRRAHHLQFQLLPRSLPDEAPVRVAAVLESFCHLSGDLFGWEMLRSGSFLLWIADVAGHGVRSGLCAAVLKILIDNAKERDQVGRLVTEIDRALLSCRLDDLDGLFATGFFMAIEPNGAASYCSAGHPPVFLRRRGGSLVALESLATPVGLLPGGSFESRDLALESGDGLLMYSDGLTETKNRRGEEFGVDRVRRLFQESFQAPEEMTASIYHRIATSQDLPRLEDDVTFLVAKFDGPPEDASAPTGG
jgi:serine phosphatase RsbU (regulator of sigma subunit)